jgi:maltose alpha-D-glucosyltransferase/alpha-amylase
MGDDLSLPERESVRTPMQWSDERNAGFSRLDAPEGGAGLVSPIIDDDTYGYQQINVAEQMRNSESLLNWTERAIRIRKRCPEFGLGEWRILETDAPSVLALAYTLHQTPGQDGIVIAAHNLSDQPCTVTLDLSAYDATHLIDLLADRRYNSGAEQAERIELEGYGYRWFRVDGRLHPGP